MAGRLDVEMHEIRIHIDGEKRSSSGRGADSLVFLPFSEPIFLGAANNQGNAERFYRGLIDEVRIYDRALTENEIKQNYKSRFVYKVDPVEKLTVLWGTLKSKQ